MVNIFKLIESNKAREELRRKKAIEKLGKEKIPRRIQNVLSRRENLVKHEKVVLEKEKRVKEPTLKQIRKELSDRRKHKKKERLEKKILADVKQRRSVAGRLGRGLQKVYTIPKRGITQSLYDRESPVITSQKLTKTGGVKTGRRGRPRGSFDSRYSKYGGVYGYRKAVAHQRKLERLQYLRQVSVTPRQREALSRIESRQNIEKTSVERRVIPNTYGAVAMQSYHQEIEDASNLVS